MEDSLAFLTGEHTTPNARMEQCFIVATAFFSEGED
jgi:hypothetical protein